ncbi:MAG: TIGR03915 family putative DNA repair protein [Akkermansiaceae bacterium]|jgi:DNA polymerase|nr:TIGR03915 family putative DNA repair protein [Akkermansiaceae bacterium]
MRCVDPGDNFHSWRGAARDLIECGVRPDEILWEKEQGLFRSMSSVVREGPAPTPVKVPQDFIELAKSVSCHKDPSRWGLLYRILWRLTRGGEKHLLDISSDPDVSKAIHLEKNVRREIHKLHAFVRFKEVPALEGSERERYAAWFEPEHWIVELGTPFFRKRFANMDWSILTPKGCAHWDGIELRFTPGIAENPLAHPDDTETAWLTYYRSIFNPARLKVNAMQAEMPKRYWKNLPEAALIEELISNSKNLVSQMLDETPRPVKPRPKNAYLDHLHALNQNPAAADGFGIEPPSEVP